MKADATRARRLGPDLDRVAGTSLDKGAELDALAAMPAEDRAPLIRRASAGENVSALQEAAARDWPLRPILCSVWMLFDPCGYFRCRDNEARLSAGAKTILPAFDEEGDAAPVGRVS